MELETITLPSGLRYSLDWERDGAIVMHNAKTVKLYNDLKYGKSLHSDDIKTALDNWERSKAIVAKECDPQEVYFYEYENYESMYAFDGDEEAIKIIIEIYGEQVARRIRRHNACHTIDSILTPRDVKFRNMLLDRMRQGCDYFLGNGNRSLGCIGGSIENHIARMRELLAEQPDKYKPEWLTSEMIDEYETKMLNNDERD